jgi:sodium-dependent dicarboxylate transporter 2/3/5
LAPVSIRFLKPPHRHWGFWLGLLLAAAAYATTPNLGGSTVAARMAAIGTLMAVWWLTEALPLSVTALVPLVAFPLLGILPAAQVSGLYINSIIFLFLGGFVIARTLEHWGLHRRLALGVLLGVGLGPGRLLAGFVLASGLLSMWISNMATTLMLLPIALSVCARLASDAVLPAGLLHRFRMCLLLGVAYGASVGGLATPVGTAPNLILLRMYQPLTGASQNLGFGEWLVWVGPLALGLLGLVWLVLWQVWLRGMPSLPLGAEALRTEAASLGGWRPAERRIAGIFGLTAALWVTRQDIPLGWATLPGWGRLLPEGVQIDDGTIAMFGALLCFLVPAGPTQTEPADTAGVDDPPKIDLEAKHAPGRKPAALHSQTLANAQTLQELPWPLLLLFGGGFALATGLQGTGLSAWLGGHLAGLAAYPLPVVLLGLSFGISLLTELTSNTATTEMILPILGSVSSASGLPMLPVLLVATLSASLAFMLPVATPPNTLVYGTGYVPIRAMVITGVWLNLTAPLLMASWMWGILT